MLALMGFDRAGLPGALQIWKIMPGPYPKSSDDIVAALSMKLLDAIALLFQVRQRSLAWPAADIIRSLMIRGASEQH